MFLIGGGRGCCGWPKRGKENEVARNPSFYAFHLFHANKAGNSQRIIPE